MSQWLNGNTKGKNSRAVRALDWLGQLEKMGTWSSFKLYNRVFFSKVNWKFNFDRRDLVTVLLLRAPLASLVTYVYILFLLPKISQEYS